VTDQASSAALAAKVTELERALGLVRTDLTAATILLHVPAVAEALAGISDEDLAREGVPARYLARRQDLTVPLRNFSWILPGALCGCGRPLSRADLAALRGQGVRYVVTLMEEPLPASWADAVGMATTHVPVPDRQAPSVEQMEQAVGAIEAGLQSGGAVAVHCFAGLGRTNSVLGAFLVHRGRTADEANEELRRLRPENPDRSVSERAVRTFFAHRARE
jgi:atypical dual specificity phosphatase